MALILAVRYLDVIRWGFKLTYMLLGVTVAAEVAGKALLSNGLASQLRPRKYYTVPREALDAMIGDVNELVNFFIIEAQRIVFAENVYASAAVSLPLPRRATGSGLLTFVTRRPALAPSCPTTSSRSCPTGVLP